MPINSDRHGLPRLAMGIGLRPLPILRVDRDMNVAATGLCEPWIAASG
jgi:hypothetical protein